MAVRRRKERYLVELDTPQGDIVNCGGVLFQEVEEKQKSAELKCCQRVVRFKLKLCNTRAT